MAHSRKNKRENVINISGENGYPLVPVIIPVNPYFSHDLAKHSHIPVITFPTNI